VDYFVRVDIAHSSCNLLRPAHQQRRRQARCFTQNLEELTIRTVFHHDAVAWLLSADTPVNHTVTSFAITSLSKLASINKKMAWTTVNNSMLSDKDFQTWMSFDSCYTLSITLTIWYCTIRRRLILYWSIVVQARFFISSFYVCVLHTKFIINK